MNQPLQNFCAELMAAKTAAEVADIESAISTTFGAERVGWEPLGGNMTNRGPIDVASNPGRALVERVTNGMDAVLELECARRNGNPAASTPREAAALWMGIPIEGPGSLQSAQRASIADRLTITRLDGGQKSKRTVVIRDHGIGIEGDRFPETILSINKGNKIDKKYLAGLYGQGGSSTLASSEYTLIVSRKYDATQTSFTIARFYDRPADQYKDGYYAYLTIDGQIPTFECADDFFSHGTQVTHFGYDLAGFDSNVGPRSLYGLLNQVLFDGVMPFWMALPGTTVGRRSIIGARPRLLALAKGAEDDAPESAEKSDTQAKPEVKAKIGVKYAIPKAFISLDEMGTVAFEAWLLTQPPKEKEPSRGFVDPAKPIIFTVNGQNQAELSRMLIRKNAELPYLANRLVVHVGCDELASLAKRKLFTSTREQARQSDILTRITMQLIEFLKSDTRLAQENEEAKKSSQSEMDDDQSKQIREDISKLLKLQGIDAVFSEKPAAGKGEATGGGGGGGGGGPRPPKPPLELSDPPTMVRFAWEEDTPLSIYPGQTKYLPVETDAFASRHNAADLSKSDFNFIMEAGLTVKGTTQLEGGRMRVIVHLSEDAEVHHHLTATVELRRTGASTLRDDKLLKVVPKPVRQPKGAAIHVPQFNFIGIEPDDSQWDVLNWPEDTNEICSSSELKDGVLTVHYSKVFPAFRSLMGKEEAKASGDPAGFERKYRKWPGRMACCSPTLIRRRTRRSTLRKPTTRNRRNVLVEQRDAG